MNKTSKSFLLVLAALLIAAPLARCHGAFAVRGWGGGCWLTDSDHDFDAKYNTGYAFGVSCGSTWFRLLRADLEVLRFHNTLSHIKIDSQRTDYKGDLTLTAGLFNLQIECPPTLLCMGLSPYFGIGAGGGTVKTKLHGKGLPKIRDNDSHSIYQAFGGLSKTICPLCIGEISIEVEGRYLVFDKHLRAAMAICGLTLKF